MTSGAVNELPKPWRRNSPRKGAVVAFAIVLAGGLAGLLLVAGHPRSNWYYPFILALGGLAAARMYRRIERETFTLPRQISSERASVIWSVVEGVITAGLAMLFFALLWDEPSTAGVPVFLGLMAAVSGYRQRRGLPPHPYRVSIIVAATFLIAFAAALYVIRRVL